MPRLDNGTGTVGAVANPLFTAAKHVVGTGKAPCTATVMDLQAADLDTFAAAASSFHTRGYNFPTGGLMAAQDIINLSKAGSFTGEATAVIVFGNWCSRCW